MHTGLLISELERSVNRAAAASVLIKCAYEDPEGHEWCYEKGIISDLVTERTVCRKHFADLERCF
jgi:hypothetical protein